jgi:hypothetical protein
MTVYIFLVHFFEERIILLNWRERKKGEESFSWSVQQEKKSEGVQNLQIVICYFAYSYGELRRNAFLKLGFDVMLTERLTHT